MRSFAFLIVCALLVSCAPLWASGEDVPVLPEQSTVYDGQFAEKMLSYSSTFTAADTARVLSDDGYTVLLQKHYDKAADDASHTSAYTVAQKEVIYKGENRPLIAVVIRGTSGGEWFSNFNFAPSQDNDTYYAENFLYAAQDILLGMQDVLSGQQRPLIWVTGHSRGGACANLLGVMLDALYDPDGVFVYTFASPTTQRNISQAYDNIFNIINPCDVVTYMPLSQWGYTRAGQDILLPADATQTAQLTASMEQLAALAPTIASYYQDRHSLTGAGLDSEKGITLYQFFTMTAASLANGANTGAVENSGSSMAAVSPDSDLAPLMQMVSGLFAAAGEGTSSPLMAHAPATYMALLTAINSGSSGSAP